MSQRGFWDRVLRLLGTNRVQAGWRWRRFKEGWRAPEGGGARAPRVRLSGLIPDEFPIVSVTLVGLSVVFFFLSVKMTQDATGESGLSPAPMALVRYGAVYTPLVTQGGEWWRLLSSVFLHGGAMHMIMNGLGLWIVGSAVEQHFGRARALVVFAASGVAGMAASLAWHPVVLVVGASGGIFGFMGCVLGHALRHRASSTAQELRSRFVPWLIYGLILGFAIPGVDNAAHLGGLAAGAAFGAFLGEQGRVRRLRGAWEALAVLTILFIALSFFLAARSPFLP
jgi:membrane associated rhomboid family serine protease